MLPLAIFLLLLGLALLWLTSRRQKASGIPAGRIIYTDTSKWNASEKALYDPVLGLTGRPDYLVQQGEQIIPVEVKSGRAPDAPYDTHIYQVAAYCRLVQATYGSRPTYGILHYPERTFAIDYTPELEASLLDILSEIRQQDRQKEIARSHESAGRCTRCGFRSICDQKLPG
jgi:CRISPR-associated exonuclease Cas4